ncbi:uncharacterized protein BYT42DRAFT_586008 [Radiomyces spectabilis]|uniref:uncharacterized protein n=1 Tax=Radiomyces spectabilis TaxID=64574 RepID=UPI00221E4270|nr:uncharacterized protein BYT42DRAFT_586008 [Radiomyces spectabilis]KAI8368272.1 hypothetical protein BYT42DRAFT_586008 [Radiomyces spectabilis]
MSLMLLRIDIPLKAAFAKGMAVPLRSFSSSVPAADQGKERMEAAMNKIEELFAAAKDEMEYAEESQGSVYYHEDRVTAEKAVKDCIDAFDTFLKDLPTDEMRAEVQGKVGMKIKELKMAFEALPEEGH